jgi:translation initiation factor IF-2
MSPRQMRRRPNRPQGNRRGGGRAGGPAAVVDDSPSPIATLDGQRVVEISQAMTVKDLATLLNVTPVTIIKELMKNGVLATVNQIVDAETAGIVASELGFEIREPEKAEVEPVEAGIEVEQVSEFEDDDPALLLPRPPVVTIMGHVDHGKTSLLDAIRSTKVAAGESGGITQHIGAYQVEVNGQPISFIDTPGHAAFTAMRARGAQVTDIAVIVVAADDGVMPQTKEAIDHARAASVSIIIALNKMDRDNINPDRVKQQLADQNVLIEEYGGDIPLIPVSARTGEGIPALLEYIATVAEVAELKANPNRPGRGYVLESKLDRARGPVATVLVKSGTLRSGDIVVSGSSFGRIKAMLDDLGHSVKEAGPSMPVELLGLNSVAPAGERFEVVPEEKIARQRAEARTEAQRDTGQTEVTLEDVFAQIQAGQVKELNVVVKADVQGSVEPIASSLDKQTQEGARIRVIHAAVGNITESDVMLAAASHAVVVGFRVKLEPGAKRTADSQRVDLRFYDVIYELVDDLEKAVKGLLGPTISEVVEGHAEVRQIFRIGRNAVAGCYVLDGSIHRNSRVRILRRGDLLYEGRINTLRRFKDDVREVATGYECGIGIEGFIGFEEGDVLEAFGEVETPAGA